MGMFHSSPISITAAFGPLLRQLLCFPTIPSLFTPYYLHIVEPCSHIALSLSVALI